MTRRTEFPHARTEDTRALTVRVHKDEYAELQAAARAEGLTVTAYATDAMRREARKLMAQAGQE